MYSVLDRFECEPDNCGCTILLNQKHLDAVEAIEESRHDLATPLQRLDAGFQSRVPLFILPLL